MSGFSLDPIRLVKPVGLVSPPLWLGAAGEGGHCAVDSRGV